MKEGGKQYLNKDKKGLEKIVGREENKIKTGKINKKQHYLLFY